VNRDQTRLVAAMEAQGWRLAKQALNAVMFRGLSMAIIRPNRSTEVIRIVDNKPTHFCYVQAYRGRGWCDLAVSIATAAAKTSLTSEQFGALLHAIGAADGRPGYRNYATTAKPFPCLDALVEVGFMTSERYDWHEGGAILDGRNYRVTPKGAAEVGCAGCLETRNG